MSGHTPRLTLKDMARRLNVSTATVSNAFNRPNQLSGELRERILSECRRAGYLGPNAAARSLRTGRTGIIGVMLSNYLSYSFSDPVAHQFLQGLAEVFEQRQYNLLIMPSRDHVAQAQGVEAFVDGFLIYGPPEPRKLERLMIQHKSIITVDFELEGSPSVNIDNYQSARECAEHALKANADSAAILGLRIIDANRVCRISNSQLFDARTTISVQRLNGYLDAARAAGVDIQKERIWHIPDNTHELGYQASREALMSAPLPRVLLCMSDRIGLAAIRAAHHLNLKVPEDVRITGFDDIPEAASQEPSLTTVHQQSIDKGRIAAQMFVGERPEENIVLPTRIMIRKSCP